MSKVEGKTLLYEEVKSRGILDWPVWEKEISRFEWKYDSDEQCLILDGEAIIETDEGDYHIKAGDFVTFQKGLKCIWDIKKDIRKHYNFK